MKADSQTCEDEIADGVSSFPLGGTRREFLAQAATAGAGAVLLPELAARAVPAPVSPSAVTPLVAVTMKVNGEEHKLTLDPRTTVLDMLREKLGLTGSKKGCDHGQCGACTILVNGRRINSCLALALVHEGDEITTIEGIAHGEDLHPVQAAFIQCDGFQCGYCTPGQIMSTVALMKEGCPKTDGEIREAMSGNICRCGAYNGILDAIRQVRDHHQQSA
ncbi:MAG: aromatic aldehyde oxidoreductase iron-sulfur subunit [Verrucomicrobiaceae bacterium]|nr:aromatic aldehyde oxidoreductase iron-sulfur subunit [Verrucomicrobiaceae bacterium]